MANARLLHKKGSHGERVIALDHLEFRVWVQYVLSADDYGVMRASASVLRADNPRLERESIRKVERAMTAVEAAGLVQSFEHQGVKFWWQSDWQDFQGVRYPRETVNPPPPDDALAGATDKTRDFFGCRAGLFRERSRSIHETDPTPVRAGGRQTLTLTPTPPGSGSAEEIQPSTGLHPRDAGLINGSSIRRHGTHAWCSLPREGLCVPVFLHDEFIGKLGRPDGAQALRAWYASTVAKFDGVAVGEDSLRFWRNEFAIWVGTVTTAPATAIGRRTAAQTTIATANRG